MTVGCNAIIKFNIYKLIFIYKVGTLKRGEILTRPVMEDTGYRMQDRGATGAARAPKPGKSPIMAPLPPPPSIFQNQGKATALPALPGTALL